MRDVSDGEKESDDRKSGIRLADIFTKIGELTICMENIMVLGQT